MSIVDVDAHRDNDFCYLTTVGRISGGAHTIPSPGPAAGPHGGQVRRAGGRRIAHELGRDRRSRRGVRPAEAPIA